MSQVSSWLEYLTNIAKTSRLVYEIFSKAYENIKNVLKSDRLGKI